MEELKYQRQSKQYTDGPPLSQNVTTDRRTSANLSPHFKVGPQ